MSQNPDPSVQETTERLVQKLESLRQAKADFPEGERREAFHRALEDGLTTLPQESADQVLTGIRERLIAAARSRDDRIAELESQVSELGRKAESMAAERERLIVENRRLQETAGAAAAAPATRPDSLDKIRQGLISVSQGKNITAESIGVTGADVTLYRLIRELFDFALKFELSVNVLLVEFKVGGFGDADTRMLKAMREEVRTRFRDCLEEKEGSIEALKHALGRNASFLIELNKAYTGCLYEGGKSLLGELNPQQLAEKHKGLMGVNHEQVWKAATRILSDLINLSRGEMWERFYFPPFRKRLQGRLEDSKG